MDVRTDHTAKGAVLTDLVLEVFRLNGALLAAGDGLGADIGLTSARWQVLGALADGPQMVPRIARDMGLTRQGVQRTVNVLLDEGLVALRDNPHHKRAKLVDLTAEGRARLDEVTARQMRWANAVTERLAMADLQTAARAAAGIRAVVERLQRESHGEPA
jgi:DNA-binding MarR family transcriptional regulator